MTEPLKPPKRKNPLARTRQVVLPQGIRSRTAQGLTAAAAEGRFRLQVCTDCRTVIYPPRDACPACLSARLPFEDVDPQGRLVSATTVRVSPDSYFRERLPWRIGLVQLDAGPVVVAHLHGDLPDPTAESAGVSRETIPKMGSNSGQDWRSTSSLRPPVGQSPARQYAGRSLAAARTRVRLALRLDKAGAPVMLALPQEDTPDMADDPQLRELTCDPKFRRVLVTDGRHTVGQAVAAACAEAGASLIFVGIADPWKPFPGEAALRAIPHVEIVPLDLTDGDAVTTWAGQNAGRVDILINTAEHVRSGGLMDRPGVSAARDAMEVRYFGLMRLAQAFGPALRARGADGVNAATAFVNILSVHAMANWPAYGVFSAVEAACLSASHSLRAELRPGGIKVVNVFTGPTETEWFQTVPPPKVAPKALARAVIDALRRGLEDVFVGDVAQDIRARLAVNPKAVERELGEGE